MDKINKYSVLKTLGPKSALLIMSLYDESKSLFTSEDAERLTGLSGNTLNVLLSRLVKKGITTRLKSGLFNIVPFELGSESTYLSDRELIAESIVHQKGLTQNDYYISHGSAFELHQMVTQPQLSVSCSVTKRISNENVHGTQISFHVVKKEQMFGVQKFWIGKDKAVQVSDLERTIIDGLKNPLYCGGIIEVAKGLWIKKDVADIKKMISYALLLDSGVVIRRLGYLLELFNLGTKEQRELLEKKLTKTYALLDPDLFQEGKYISKWKLRLNVTPDELLSAVRS
jgi:predicted transcriptional regulator of viral defense system